MERDLNMRDLRRFPQGKALAVLFLFFLGGLLLSIVLSAVLGVAVASDAALKWSVVAQNVFAFMLPAFFMAAMLFGMPWRFLEMSRKPSLAAVAGLLLVYIVMTPAMNWLIAWNESVSLPDWLLPVERWMKESEAAAQAVTDRLVDVSSLPMMLLTVGYVGVLTGLGEEMFFRGALQNVLVRSVRNPHVAVWTAAVVFSVLHFQFYGFVPRVLLGAFFGYALLWSRSLWVPVIGHALNNSVVVVSAYLEKQGLWDAAKLSEVGSEQAAFPFLPVVSLLLAVALMFGYRKLLVSDNRE